MKGRLGRFLDTTGRRLGELLESIRSRFKNKGAGVAAVADAPVRPRGLGQFLEGDYSNAAGHRAYKLYVPGGYGDAPLPLLVMLHGCGQTPDDFAVGTGMNELAEQQDCLVLYPAQPVSANRSRCWNWFSPGDQQRDQGEPSLIAGMTRQVMADYGTDPQRVYIAGLSAGGAAAAIMGMAYPDLYAAIGVHSGLACGAANGMFSAFMAMRSGRPLVVRAAGRDGGARARDIMPTIVFHGDRDTTVHPANGDRVIAQSKDSAGMPLRMERFTGQVPDGHAWSRILYSDPAGRTVLEQWIIHGAGHAWSGGCAKGSYIDPRGPDATREMLQFFLRHRQSLGD
jgi:poly(hydroxyalkanoate) depolymerase family esterase